MALWQVLDFNDPRYDAIWGQLQHASDKVHVLSRSFKLQWEKNSLGFPKSD